MASPGCEWRSVAAPVQWPPTTGVPVPVRSERVRIWCCYVERVKLLALTLLVARVVLADDHDVAVAADDAAVLTHGLDAGGDLHFFLLSLSSY